MSGARHPQAYARGILTDDTRFHTDGDGRTTATLTVNAGTMDTPLIIRVHAAGDHAAYLREQGALQGRRLIVHGIIHEEENADEAYILADEMALHTSVKDALP